jgi:hypothetical protein
VLAGTGDELFQRAKNDWSKPINPESIGGKVARVVELRHIYEFLSDATTGVDLTRLEAAVDRLVALFKVYKATLT